MMLPPNHARGSHRDIIEKLLIKLFPQANDTANGSMVTEFWEEYEKFDNKEGPYAKPHIWKASDIANNRSHEWHKKFSVPHTKILGSFAYIVCSKILGIGSAERSWGDVKHHKTDKRAHLSADQVKKQATLFGSYCTKKAEIKMQERQNDPYYEHTTLMWEEDDLALIGLNKFGFDRNELNMYTRNDGDRGRVIRVFNAYEEEWR